MKQYNTITDLYSSNSSSHGDMISVLEFVEVLEMIHLITATDQFTQLHIPYISLGGNNIQLIDAGCLANPRKVKEEGDIDYVLYHDMYNKGQDGNFTRTRMTLKSTFEKVLIKDEVKTVWMKSQVTMSNPVSKTVINKTL